MFNTLKAGRKLGQRTVGGIATYLALSVGCTPVPDVCTKNCGDAGAPGDDASGGKTSGGRRSADGGQPLGGAGDGGHTSSGGDLNVGGEGGVGSGGMNMGGDPVVLVPSLEVELEVPDVLRLDQGSSADFAVTVVRGGGFEGPVQLSITGLPDGTIAGSALLVKGEDSTEITLIAADDGEMGGPFEVELIATSLDGELIARQTFSLLVAGAPGEVDTSFGDGGMLHSAIDRVVAMENDPRGGVFVAGNTFAPAAAPLVQRLDESGEWDTAPRYSSPIVQSNQMGSFAVDAKSLWVQMGNGSTAFPYRIARLDLDGAPDKSFGTNGLINADNVTVLPRPSGGAWLARIHWDNEAPADVTAIRATGEADDTFTLFANWAVEHVGVDAKGRLLVGWFNGDNWSEVSRVLPDGAQETTFGVATPWSQVKASAPLGDQATAFFFGGGYEAGVFVIDEHGKLSPTFGTGGVLNVTKLLADSSSESPDVLDSTVASDERLVLLYTGNRGTFDVAEKPGKVFVFDSQGTVVTTFASSGVLDLNTTAPALHTANERLFPRKVVIDEEFGRAIVAVEVAPLDSNVPVETALVRIWL